MNKHHINQLKKYVEPLQAYHRHTVKGIGNIPEDGPCLVVVNHSLATYDILLLLKEIYDHNGRVTRSLMDRWFFIVPQIGEFMHSIGAVQGAPTTAKELLEKGEIVCVAPGGMMESLRPSTERYQIMWEKRKGFARIAMETGAPIVLAACPKADDIFEVYPTKFLTSFFYKNFKIPLPIARGLGPTPIPRPVPLTHFLSEPIQPPKIPQGKEAFKKALDAFHKKLIKRMKELMGEAVTYREES